MNVLKAQRTTTGVADTSSGKRVRRMEKSYVGAGDIDAWLRDAVGGRKVAICDECGQCTYWL